MDAFQILRKQARDKRDAIIRAARAEYGQACKRINALRAQIGSAGTKVPFVKLRPIVALIADVAPQDRTFTVAELIDLLVKAEPGRTYLAATIREYCQRLTNQGILRRVTHNKGQTLWAAAAFRGAITVGGKRRLPEVAAQLLREHGPMRSVELLARVRQSGYRAEDSQTKVLKALRTALSRSAAFRQSDDGKWAIA